MLKILDYYHNLLKFSGVCFLSLISLCKLDAIVAIDSKNQLKLKTKVFLETVQQKKCNDM